MWSRRAFTLIELLVVIGIVALLVGLLAPALGRARRCAGEARCLVQLRTLAQFSHIYADDHRDFMPRSQHSAFAHQAAPWGYAFFEPLAGHPYQPGDPAWEAVFNGPYRCPLDRRDSGWSYGFNVYFELDPGETLGPVWVRRSNAPSPHATVLFGELLAAASSDHAMAHFWTQAGAPPEIDPRRHQAGTGVAFLDGHAATHSFQRLFDLDSNTDRFNPATAR